MGTPFKFAGQFHLSKLSGIWGPPLYIEPTNGRSYQISSVYLITNGKITNYAKTYLKEHTGQWLFIIDGDALDRIPPFPLSISDDEWCLRIAMLKIDITQWIIPLSEHAAKQFSNTITNKFIPPNICPTHSLNRFMDIAAHDLDPKDLTLFLFLQTHVDAYNAFHIKIPLGPVHSDALPSLKAFGELCQTFHQKAGQCKDILDTITDLGRPEPGQRIQLISRA